MLGVSFLTHCMGSVSVQAHSRGACHQQGASGSWRFAPSLVRLASSGSGWDHVVWDLSVCLPLLDGSVGCSCLSPVPGYSPERVPVGVPVSVPVPCTAGVSSLFQCSCLVGRFVSWIACYDSCLSQGSSCPEVCPGAWVGSHSRLGC